jgi:FAD-dependent urate hydroxylase
MQIVIAGAGIGGLTLAALLQRRGLKPVIVDRAPDFSHAGYMLGLYPIGNRVLHGLGLFDRFVAESAPMATYCVYNGHCQLVHEYDLGAIGQRLGPIRQIARTELLGVLREGCKDADLRMSATVAQAIDTGEVVEIKLSDGTEMLADLLVGADGVHSAIRRDHIGEAEVHATHWGAWVWWADRSLTPSDTVAEYWGAGRLVGVYPTRHKIGLVAAGPIAQIGPEVVGDDSAELKGRFGELAKRLAPAFARMPARTAEIFFWKLEDCRAPAWHKGRVVLLGDSACGFLPTAGIGASMAMESAAVLADELDRTDAHYLPNALSLYEKRRRKRAEAAQDDSRKIAKLMFVESLPLAWGRDQLMKMYSLEMLAGQIAKSLDEPI